MYTPQIGDKVIAFDALAWQKSPAVSINHQNASMFWKYATVVSLYSTKKDPSRIHVAVVFDFEKTLARTQKRTERISYGHPVEWILVIEKISKTLHTTPVHGKAVHETAIKNREVSWRH